MSMIAAEYASVLLNRLMFIYFLQRKLFLDKGDSNYLQNKLAFMQKSGRDLYYEKFLKVLFFEGFAKPEDKRSPEANKLLGKDQVFEWRIIFASLH